MSELKDVVAKRKERKKEVMLRKQPRLVEENERMIEVEDAKLEKRRREVNAQREAIEREMCKNGFQLETTSSVKRKRSEKE